MARAVALSSRVEHFARRTATPVKLEDLYAWGIGNTATRLRMAHFLHTEVAIRNAQLCKELMLLPFGLAKTRGVRQVIEWFSSYVDIVADCPTPETAGDEKQFTALLANILDHNSAVPRTIGQGVHEVRADLGVAGYEDVRSEVDLILDRFFMKRIGLRFLLEHYVESASERPGASGIIHDNVATGSILRKTAAEVQQLCFRRHGIAPEITVWGDSESPESECKWNGAKPISSLNLLRERSFTYVPSHLRFVCFEVLKNACFAVASRNTGSSLPPVQVIFSYGEDEVTVKIADEGGGIPRSQVLNAWSYFNVETNSLQADNPKSPTGVGLPFARLHARYYGGDLVLKSMDGFGTDAFLIFSRLGHVCENLPHGVRISAAQRDSSVNDEAFLRIDSLGDINEMEASFLARRLHEYRSRKRTDRGSHDDSKLSSRQG